MNNWVKYLLWFLGMLVLLFLVSRIENVVYRTASLTFSMKSEVWTVSLISVAMGIYLSLLFISGKFHFNIPLFVCVFIPSLIFGFYYPLAFLYGHLHVPTWLPSFDRHGLAHVVSGLSLMMSLFNGRKSNS